MARNMKKDTSKVSRSISTKEINVHDYQGEGRVKFDTGAVRSNTTANNRGDVDYTVVCPAALRSLARTMAEGAKKYGKHNWTKGIPNSNSLNHAMAHLQEYLEGDRSEDHLGHALANIQFIIHFNDNCSCRQGFELLEAINKE